MRAVSANIFTRSRGEVLEEKKVFGEISGNRFTTQTIIAGSSKEKSLSPMCFQRTCDTQLFNVWLELILLRELEPGQVLILDSRA